jgi:hypothetical protein
MLRWVASLNYSVDQGQKEKQLLHGILQKKKQHFKESGQILLKDIKETRDKVKEKMEEIIEVSQSSNHQHGTAGKRLALFHSHRDTVPLQ